MVLVKNFLSYNPLENPNQVKAAISQMEQLPATPLLISLAKILEQMANPLYEPLREAVWERVRRVFGEGWERVSEPLGNPSERVSKPFRNQEQEPEQEQEVRGAIGIPSTDSKAASDNESADSKGAPPPGSDHLLSNWMHYFPTERRFKRTCSQAIAEFREAGYTSDEILQEILTAANEKRKSLPPLELKHRLEKTERNREKGKPAPEEESEAALVP